MKILNNKLFLMIFLSIILITGIFFLSGCELIEEGTKVFDYLSKKAIGSGPLPEHSGLTEEDVRELKLDEAADEAKEEYKKEKEKKMEESKQQLIKDDTEDIEQSTAEGTSEEEKQNKLPDFITLKGSIWTGSELTLIVDMKTKKVEGSVYYKSDDASYDGKIIEGNIDIATYEINARCCGYWKVNWYPEQSEDKCIDIKGKLSMDGKTASGIAEVWTGPNLWTANSVK